MKKFILILFGAVFFAAAVQASPLSPDLIAQIHFAGAQPISTDTNSAAFTNLFCSAEARALESQTLDKLSRAPFAWFKSKIPAGAGDGIAQLRPLLDDLLKSEWIFEMRDASNGSPEYALAIRLSNGRAQLWQNNLSGLLESWTKLPAKKIPDGWELKKHLPPDLIRVVRVQDWLVVGCGENELPLNEQIVQNLSKFGVLSKENSWLTADLNWPRLAQLFPALAKFDFPKIEMQVVGRGGSLQWNGKFMLAQPLPPLEKWRLPTSTIHPPFESFTAVRGFAPWLARQGWAQPYEISPPPGQIFIWSLPFMPFQTFAAEPVPDAANALVQLGTKLSAAPKTAPPAGSFMQFRVAAAMTNNQIFWRGVPFMSPFIKPLHEPAGDFLFGGFFPNTPRSKLPPPEFFAQLNRPDLVYYHWEMTGARLKQLPQLSQLTLLLSQHRQLDGKSDADKWLDQIGPTLGNSVTEITQTAPDELAFMRKAPGGLTAIELVALANWLEATNFPGCDLGLPPRPMNLKRPMPAQKPGAPSAPPFLLH